MTLGSYISYVFQSESTLSSRLNVKKLLAWNKCNILSLSVCHRIRTHNHYFCERTLKYLAKLVVATLEKWFSIFLGTMQLWARILLLYFSLHILTQWVFLMYLVFTVVTICNHIRHIRSKLVNWNESVYCTPIDRAFNMPFNRAAFYYQPFLSYEGFYKVSCALFWTKWMHKYKKILNNFSSKNKDF